MYACVVHIYMSDTACWQTFLAYPDTRSLLDVFCFLHIGE